MKHAHEAKARWERFIEKQGFAVLVGTCIAVIAASAMLSGHTSLPAAAAPTPPVSDAQSAARLLQESLAEAIENTPVPESRPVTYRKPLDSIEVLQGFDDKTLRRFAATGIWAVHAAVDLKAQTGDPVHAIAAGTVRRAEESGLIGGRVTIEHEGGLTAEYAGLARLSGLRAGDPVSAGQTIGFVGGQTLAENDQPPHLHLEITRNGTAVDPMTLWRQ